MMTERFLTREQEVLLERAKDRKGFIIKAMPNDSLYEQAIDLADNGLIDIYEIEENDKIYAKLTITGGGRKVLQI